MRYCEYECTKSPFSNDSTCWKFIQRSSKPTCLMISLVPLFTFWCTFFAGYLIFIVLALYTRHSKYHRLINTLLLVVDVILFLRLINFGRSDRCLADSAHRGSFCLFGRLLNVFFGSQRAPMISELDELINCRHRRLQHSPCHASSRIEPWVGRMRVLRQLIAHRPRPIRGSTLSIEITRVASRGCLLACFLNQGC